MVQQTKLLRKRKALVVLPLVVIPFLTLAFWALGGGRGAEVQEEKEGGLNVHLPDPQLKEAKGQDKLSFYDTAERDSVKRKEYLPHPAAGEAGWDTTLESGYPFDPAPYAVSGGDVNEEKVYRRLEQLQRQLQKPAAPEKVPHNPSWKVPAAVDPFQSRPPVLPSLPVQEDPQLEQLNAMMDKILDIQQPQRLKERDKALPEESPLVYAAEKAGTSMSVSLLGAGKDTVPMDDQFYSLEKGAPALEENTVGAVIHGNQKIKEGGVVKLRLRGDLKVGKTLIPRGTFLFGTARQQGERLQVQISTLRYGEFIFPLALQVYDMDGLEGITIPGTITGDAARDAIGHSFQQMEWLDPSLKAKAAAAGVQAARSLLTKGVKQKTIILRAGYQVLLRNKKM